MVASESCMRDTAGNDAEQNSFPDVPDKSGKDYQGGILGKDCIDCYEDFDLFEFKGIGKLRKGSPARSYIQVEALADSSTRLTGFIHKSIINAYKDSVINPSDYLVMYRKIFKKGLGMHYMISGERGEGQRDSVYHQHYFYKDRVLMYTIMVGGASDGYPKGKRKLIFEEINRKDRTSAEVSVINTNNLPKDIQSISNDEIFNKYISKYTILKGGYICDYQSTSYHKISKGRIEGVVPPKEYKRTSECRFYPTSGFSYFWNMYLGMEDEKEEEERIFDIFKK